MEPIYFNTITEYLHIDIGLILLTINKTNFNNPYFKVKSYITLDNVKKYKRNVKYNNLVLVGSDLLYKLLEITHSCNNMYNLFDKLDIQIKNEILYGINIIIDIPSVPKWLNKINPETIILDWDGNSNITELPKSVKNITIHHTKMTNNINNFHKESFKNVKNITIKSKLNNYDFLTHGLERLSVK